MRRLVAGPWAGEFGWEIMSWQGLLRKLSSNYDEVIVSAPAGHEPFYADFCTKYLPHSIRGAADRWWMPGRLPECARLCEELRRMGGYYAKPSHCYPMTKQKFIKFGDAKRAVECQNKFDVVLHARGDMSRRAAASWSLQNWNEVVCALINDGLRVAAIGTTAWLPTGVYDRRNLPLSELMDLMAAATLVVGPSSGPMHLASLCGTPHIVWTDNRHHGAIKGTNRARYEKIWNPLNTPVKVLDSEGWRPKAVTVLLAIEKGWEEWEKLPRSL